MNIDRIAREMVDVEPSADLEARIRARIRETRAARGATWWSWRVAVPLTAAAAIALALALVVQGPESRVQGPETQIGVQGSRSLPAEAAPAGAAAQAGPEVVSSPSPKFPSSPVARVRASQLSKFPTSQLSAEELAWMDRRIPALDPVNGLQMDRLRVDSIQPEPLAITPLTMTPVGTDGAGIERRNDR